MGSVRGGNTARPFPYYESEAPPAAVEPLPAPPPRQWPRWNWLDWTDWLVAAMLTLSVSIACLLIANQMPDYLLQSMDFWFEADTVREVSNMTSRTDDHSRTSVHPLFSILTFVPVYLVQQTLAIPSLRAVLYVTSFLGGLWIGTLFILLRLLGCRKLDATIFTILGLSSASTIFWLPVPNSYTLGSWSIMLALMLLLSAEQGRFGASAYVIASAFTLSITVTNWLAGLLTTLARWPLKQAVQLSINAFCLVVLLWGAQKFIFPSAEFFIGSRKEAAWIHHPQSGTMQNIASSFAFHTLIAPELRFIDDDGYIQFGDDSFRLSQRLAFQFSAPGSAGALGLVAVCLWFALLLNGLWRLATLGLHLRFRLVLAALLLFELSLHMVYGEETFTYSLNFAPLLIALAALGTLSTGRAVVLLLAGLLAVCAGINNWQQFHRAVESATHFTPQREAMTGMMQEHPTRPWPRSVGHIPLAVPGSSEADHAYHEPGGDFSPQAPSFGISLWLCDTNLHPVVNSQTLPLNEIQQTFAPSAHPSIPAIDTRTPYYDATWSRLDATRWELRFKNHSPYIPAILIRSIGPAGGPVTALSWNGDQVTVNHRWTVTVTPGPASVALGDETGTDWTSPSGSVTSWNGASGWGYARLILPVKETKEDQEYRLVLTDLRVSLDMYRWYRNASERVKVDFPDRRFQASLDAQVHHLMMGLIGGETRPGDPTFFYRAWQRQGAYITAALGRAGDSNVSRVLSKFISTHDYAGGAGSEADAPGLAIWALTESASYISDPDHDRWLWPHILRKTQLIEAMLTADSPIQETFAVPSPYDLRYGQQARASLLAQPAQDGLIVGRVGNEWPSLYVNAASYRGLIAAAEFASRLGKRRDAARWRNQANGLSASWHRRPSDNLHRPVATAVQRQSSPDHLPDNSLAQPLPTYSPTPEDQRTATTLTHAHRLLRSGQSDELWRVLDRLWNRQASPGLYTWNTPRPISMDIADGWQYIRGWHNKMVVSPDYETAALLLLLQQDMLAYVDDQTASPVLVIGAGIPKPWVTQPLAVSGVAIPGGSIDWRWDGQRMRVTFHGRSQRIRLGAAFPKSATIFLTSHPTVSNALP